MFPRYRKFEIVTKAQLLSVIFEGTVDVISSEPLSRQWNVRFMMRPI